MATVDTLLVRIEADMRGLRSDLNKIQGQTANATGKMDKSFQKVSRSIKLVGAALVTGFGASVFKGIVQTGSSMEDLQVRLKALFGSTTEAAKAFDVLKDFAGRVPFSLKEIQGAAGALAPVVKNADELAAALKITGNVAAVSGLDIQTAASNIQRAFAGGASAAELLRERGVNAMLGFEQGVTVSAEETVRTFQKEFGEGGRFGTATDDLAKTFTGQMSMLGDSVFNFQDSIANSGLMDALKELIGEVKSGTEEGRSFASVIGHVLKKAVDGLTTTLKFVKANFQAVITVIGIFIGIKLGGAVLSMVTSLITLTVTLGKAAKGMIVFTAVTAASKKGIVSIVAILGSLAAVIKLLPDQMEQLNQVFKRTIEEFGGANPFAFFDDIRDEVAKTSKDLNEKFGNTVLAPQSSNFLFDKKVTKEYFESLNEDINSAKLQLKGLTEAQVAFLREQGALKGSALPPSGVTDESAKLAGDSQGRTLGDIRAAQEELAALNATLEEQARATENVKSAVADLVTEEDRLLQLQNDLKAAIQSGTGDQEKLKEALEATSQEMFKQSETGKAVMGAIGSVSDSVSSGIADVITNSGKGLKSFKDMFRDITNQIIQQLIKTKIQAMLTSAALSFGGSAFGGGGGGGGFSLGSIFSGIGSFFGFGGGGGAAPTTAVSTVGFAATGSSAAAGQSFLVGERGPELFTPRSSGMISPNNMMNIAMSGGQRLNGGGGGPNITQNFNVSTGVQQTVRAEVLNLMPLIKQESINAVIDARQRGGSLASGLGA